MKMTNKIYDVLKYIALIVLPAIGTLYFAVQAFGACHTANRL